jgi:transcriptional regulator with XRE-family HTH domain
MEGYILARIVDHPVRLWRLQLGWSQVDLAGRAGVNRSAVTAVEDGRTRMPSDRVLEVLSDGLGLSVEVLRGRIVEWLGSGVEVKPSVGNVLLITPYLMGQYYPSFSAWRRDVAPSVTALGSLLRVNPSVVSRYEIGASGFPEVLSKRLVERLGASPEYVVALEGLPRV